jgi:hypothetical protein
VVSAGFLSTAAAAMAGGAIEARSTNISATASIAADPNAYYDDQLFRSSRVGVPGEDAALRAEAGRILTNAIRENKLSAADENYLAQMIAARTGITQAEAEQRISDVVFTARQNADHIRKASAHLLLWTFVSLLLGALSASYTATIGGRQRDRVRAA